MGMRDAAKGIRVQVLAASLVTAATLASTSVAAPAVAAGAGPVATSSGFTAVGALGSVAAVSAQNAWAVGFTGNLAGAHGSLIVHWNGTVWRQVPNPDSRGSQLNGVAATSADDAWAVGLAGSKSLILHWNGRVWKRALSPILPRDADLVGVAATSARNAWAVGCTGCTSTSTLNSKPLIVRWNGSAWKRVPSPAAPRSSYLVGVAATSARNAWAVGCPRASKLSAWPTVRCSWLCTRPIPHGTTTDGISAMPCSERTIPCRSCGSRSLMLMAW